jgi:thiol-disulfide isomerase/thioredoxin
LTGLAVRRTIPIVAFRLASEFRSISAIFATSVALFASASSQCAEAGEEAEFVIDGAAKPPFLLPDSAGKSVAITAYRDGPVIVHFFATWCDACRDELPALSRLAEHAGNQRLRVVAVSVADSDLGLSRFLALHPVSFPVLLDRDRIAAKAWDVAGLPTTFVLDQGLKPRLVAREKWPGARSTSLKCEELLNTDARGSLR